MQKFRVNYRGPWTEKDWNLEEEVQYPIPIPLYLFSLGSTRKNPQEFASKNVNFAYINLVSATYGKTNYYFYERNLAPFFPESFYLDDKPVSLDYILRDLGRLQRDPKNKIISLSPFDEELAELRDYSRILDNFSALDQTSKTMTTPISDLYHNLSESTLTEDEFDLYSYPGEEWLRKFLKV